MKPSANKILKQDLVFKEIKKLKENYPDAHCELRFQNPFELLVATILSAQCTDVRVNMVTPALFKAAPTAKKMSKTSLEAMTELIRSINFFNNKAKNLIAMAQTLVEKHHGEVPQEIEALVQLPGVGRKTANVVLGNAFNIPSGMVVDTHVARLSQRLGWTREKVPDRIATDLEKLIPKEDWILVPHLLISHGRAICKARGPECDRCSLRAECPSAKSLQK